MNPDITPVTHQTSQFCKNHPEIPSGYFLSENPNTKYCKNCALNMALCGRKIEKQLTEEQLHRKQIISASTQDLMACIEQIRMGHELSIKLENYLVEITIPLDAKLKQIDMTIQQLSLLRQDLRTILDTNLRSQIQRCKNGKQESIRNAETINKIVNEIESNFINLIEMDTKQIFQQKQTQWTQLIQKHRQNIINQVNIEEKRKYIKQQFQLFKTMETKALDVIMHQIHAAKGFQIDSNKQNTSRSAGFNIECSRLVEELKINLTANAQLKDRNKKMATDRDHRSFKKKSMKQSVHTQEI